MFIGVIGKLVEIEIFKEVAHFTKAVKELPFHKNAGNIFVYAWFFEISGDLNLEVFIGDSRIGEPDAVNISEIRGLTKLFLTILVDEPFSADQVILLILKNERRIHKLIRWVRRFHLLDKVCRDSPSVIVTV